MAVKCQFGSDKTKTIVNSGAVENCVVVLLYYSLTLKVSTNKNGFLYRTNYLFYDTANRLENKLLCFFF